MLIFSKKITDSKNRTLIMIFETPIYRVNTVSPIDEMKH